MIPTLAVQEAIRARLLSDQTIPLYIEPAHIRAASVRSDQLPSIHLSGLRTEILGRASGGQIVAEVRAMAHLWAVQDGSCTAEGIAAAMMMALMDPPQAKGFAFDEWDRPTLVWSTQAEIANAVHGIVGLRTVIRWPE